jgi:carboxyl-terminal processing protease
MKPNRSVPLLVSTLLVLFLLVGGLAVKVGAEDNSFHQVVVFSEVLSLVLDNYVDPLEAERLLRSAYEGMLAGLDPHGAYLTPEELAEWKAFDASGLADPGLSVLRAGRSLQVVSVVEGSSAEAAGIEMGDQIRAVDGRPVRDLSIDQSWRMILGAPGSTVKLDLLRSSDGFKREEVELERSRRKARPFTLEVEERGIAVLRLHDLARVDPESLAEELGDVRSRGVDRLLIDLRNVADIDPRAVAATAGLFSSGSLLVLKDREGEVLESVESEGAGNAWGGSIAVLVNGATAGSAEALAGLIQEDLGGTVLGEATYGLGAEAKLYEMEGGVGLVVSAASWETAKGASWNGEGIAPDEEIRGRGTDFEGRLSDQYEQALEFLDRSAEKSGEKREAA